jgi:hypothetical protein
MQQAALPRAWGQLGLASAVGCWLVVLLTSATVVADLPAASLAGRLSMAAVGVVLIPVWLAWLGRELGVTLRRDQAAIDGVPEGRGGRRAWPRVPIGAPSWLLRLLGREPLELRPATGRQPN